MLEIVHRGRVAVLQMTHGKANALDREFCEAIVAQLEAVRTSSIQALVLIGHGQIFSAGVDLRRLLDGGPAYGRTFLPTLSRAFETLFFYPKPVVAAINGHAIAGGCVLACAADYRVMAPQAGRIGVPELLVGLSFPTIALEIMRFVAEPRHVPMLLYRGATFPGERAVEWGLVDALVEPGRLLESAVEVADTLAALSPELFALTKRQIRAPVQQRLREDRPGFDVAVQERWTAPETLAAVREYVAQTFKKSSG